MCGIAGIVSNEESKIGRYLKDMLKVMQHRGPDGAGLMIGGIVEHKEKLEELNFDNKKGNIAIGHIRLAITGGMVGLQPFQSKDGRLSLLHNGEIYNYKKLREELISEFDFETDTDSEVIVRLLEKYYNGNLEKAVKKILPKLDGVYALVITDNIKTIIARDRIGVRQLYYYINNEHTAFASEKKALMAISENNIEIHRLLPGYFAVLENSNFKTFQFWKPESIKTSSHIKNKSDAAKVYAKAIQESIWKRVAGKEHVGIIFSGGIDSFLIAFEVQKLGVSFTCYTAGREGAADIEWAQDLAQKYNFPLHIKMLTVDEIEEIIPQIIRDIEDHSLNQVEVALPIYVSVRMAQEAGERVILTGQGVDELFGGYPWYSIIADKEGYESFEKYSWEDTFLLYKECLEREDKIAMAHSIELRVPYLDLAVIEAAFRISPELKIIPGNDKLGKRIHREYCLIRGIPKEITFRKKEAAQHGAKVHDAFEELADRSGVTKSMLDSVGYNPDKMITEKLGSSSRYGFRYGARHLWKPLPQVQYYLDSHAARIGLLPSESIIYWEKINNKLQALKI